MLTRIIIFLLICISGISSNQAPGSSLPQTDDPSIDLGRPGGQGSISGIQWRDDSQFLFFLRDGKDWKLDISRRELIPTSKEEIPSGDKKDRARADGDSERSRRPARGRQYMIEPSPDGKWSALCKEWNVVLESTEGNQIIQVTTEGNRKFRYGTANWVYGEELNVRHGMWWSPDSSKLVFYEFDERPVKDFYLLSNPADFESNLLIEGYTKAGAANPKVSLLIYDLKSRRTVPVDTGDEDQYLYNMRFTPDGKELLYNLADRRQKGVQVVALDPETAQTRVVVSETQKTWQENAPMMRFLDDGRRFIWETEKTGWRQYELRNLDGSFICTLTHGDYPCTDLVRIDEERGWVYYMARSDSHPLCEQLHRVRLDGSEQRRLTGRSANYSKVHFSPDGKWITIQFEDVNTPPSTWLLSEDGEEILNLACGETIEPNRTELFSFKARDGQTDLFGLLYKPEDFDPQKTYPLIISVYGGPGSRAVENNYSPRPRESRPGFLVARIDNRGTSGRGKAFKDAVYEKLGDVDIQDQADGATYLMQRSYVDGARVGIYGHSYGGFMAAVGALKHPDVFRAAVVCSAVTDWRHYDSIYTERYMNLPQDNPEGYEKGSCAPYAASFSGKMMIMHGLVDDNVHPNNAWQLIEALNQAGKDYETRFFPRLGHSWADRDKLWSFFERHLKTAAAKDGAK